MSNFDIGTLLNYKPPRIFCEKCKALLFSIPYDWDKKIAWCPNCKVKYIPTEQFRIYDTIEYLKSTGNAISFKNPIAHGQQLASIAHNFNKGSQSYPPMRALFEAFASARQFIHFTTFGLSHILFGALKLKAQNIVVRGIAANIHPDFTPEINDYPHEAVKLEIRTFERSHHKHDWKNIPHQKLIVIDGLIAFKGTANLTNEGWRKAALGLDHVEIVTNIKEISELHNKLFSPIWAESNNNSEIRMLDIPF